jgi:NADPH:quinone reductase
MSISRADSTPFSLNPALATTFRASIEIQEGHYRTAAQPFSVTGTEETIMATNSPDTGRELRSLVTAEGTLELSLADVPVPQPKPNEVIVRVEAAPINPSDLGVLFAGADMTAATRSGPPDRPVVNAPIAPAAMRAMAARVGISLPAGNEGAGTVIATGSSPAARALLGRIVAVAPGGMYTEYRCVDAGQCLELPDGEALEPEAYSAYARHATGEKYLIAPQH